MSKTIMNPENIKPRNIYDMAVEYFEQWAVNENADTTPDENERRVGMFTPIEAIDVWLDIDENGLNGFNWVITSTSPDDILAKDKHGRVELSGIIEDEVDTELVQAFDDTLIPDWVASKQTIEDREDPEY